MEGGQRQRGEDKKSKVANVCGGGEGGQDGRGELNDSEVWTPGLPTEAGPADSTTEGNLHGNGGGGSRWMERALRGEMTGWLHIRAIG